MTFVKNSFQTQGTGPIYLIMTWETYTSNVWEEWRRKCGKQESEHYCGGLLQFRFSMMKATDLTKTHFRHKNVLTNMSFSQEGEFTASAWNCYSPSRNNSIRNAFITRRFSTSEEGERGGKIYHRSSPKHRTKNENSTRKFHSFIHPPSAPKKPWINRKCGLQENCMSRHRFLRSMRSSNMTLSLKTI